MALKAARGKALKKREGRVDPGTVTLTYDGEPMEFRGPRSGDIVLSPEKLTIAGNDYPKLDATKVFSASVLSRCYLRPAEEEGLDENEVFLTFCGIAHDDDFGFADLEQAFMEAFPAFGSWLMQRARAAQAKGEPAEK